jgi:hypothetical protein
VTAPQSPTAPNPPARPADNPPVTQQPQAAANVDSAAKDSLTAEEILTHLGKESLPSSAQTNPTASPTSIPANSSPTKTTAAPQPARPQTDVHDQKELMRRAANMRPVDIVRSVDAEDEADTEASATSDFAEGSASASQPPSENPFLKHLPRSGAASQASRSASRQPVLPTEPAPTSKPPVVERRPATTVPLQANPTLPIPDQIRELADSITNFGKTSES